MNGNGLAVLRDFPEERWMSMDLAADMLAAEWQKLGRSAADELRATGVCPRFKVAFSRVPFVGHHSGARNLDRLVNRLWHYPKYVRRNVRDAYRAFHIADHSYAQLVHALPSERTGVYCHDLDTFRCLILADHEQRPRWFKVMARHILRGMQKASVVFHSTLAVREQILRHGLIDPQRLVHAPLGIASEFNALEAQRANAEPARGVAPSPFILHVGTCITRKRIDVLLAVFSKLRAVRRELRLVQVGGPWTAPQHQQLLAHGLDETAVTQLRNLTREQLSELYRTASVVLQPSEAEGFGIPVIEALACGAPVVASDIPTLREVGGDAITYCPVADVGAWATTVGKILDDPDAAPPRADRLAWAARYSWAAHARTIADAYTRLLDGKPVAAPTSALAPGAPAPGPIG